jgi:hypothetical protein
MVIAACRLQSVWTQFMSAKIAINSASECCNSIHGRGRSTPRAGYCLRHAVAVFVLLGLALTRVASFADVQTMEARFVGGVALTATEVLSGQVRHA